MKCKFKATSNERLCQAINGECLFITSHYGSACPIYHCFTLDEEILYVDSIATADMFDESITTEAIVDILDIITT